MASDDHDVCAAYFDHKVRIIMSILSNKQISPFGRYYVVDYFRHIEYQHMGSTHAYIILWLNDAPDEQLGESMPETIRMAEQLMSVGLELVPRPRTQTDQPTHMCYKNGRTKCRFNAPFWPMPESPIATPLHTPKTEQHKGEHKRLKKHYDKFHDVLGNCGHTPRSPL
ncbi:hypothetical protein HPB49_010591 [Dermacentor silvarum]|uniref:Uncharacterized protein n=1 Tax=Dermacentor silvarum TaxID=543639 RepID=A0ACB8DP59_DERSI|nr:hypothetical protein HPB49_010591 [Dermacentor silvarum]